jgi:hypothetical protein
MLKNLSQKLFKFSHGWPVLASLLVFLFFMAWVLPEQAASTDTATGDASSPDLSLYYTSSELYRMAADYGQMGRKAYINARFTFDLVYPLVYAAFLALATSFLLPFVIPTGSAWRRLNLLPVVAAVFDYLENIATSLVMARFPTPTPVADVLAGVFTLVKWGLLGASFLLLAGASAAAAFNQLKKAP